MKFAFMNHNLKGKCFLKVNKILSQPKIDKTYMYRPDYILSPLKNGPE